MSEPFKNLVGEALVRAIGAHLHRAWRRFPKQQFERQAIDGLAALELKARVDHIAAALQATLPTVFAQAADVLEGSLAPARTDTDLSALQTGPEGLAGWPVWPLTTFVARAGLAEPVRALRCLHALTQRHTAEYAVRPFLLEHPRLAFATLADWVADDSAHVRRLVSEGSRPRLPWGVQLSPLIADPSPTLPWLRVLQDDTSDYVRRSVANHLNDIAKDHPVVVAEWLERHLPGAPAERRSLLKHASRTLIKRADARVLKAWGLGGSLRGEASLAITPRRATIGGEVVLSVTLRSKSARPQQLVVDYAVHHRKANGSTSPKVWKGWSLTLAPGESRELTKRHSLRTVTTRRERPGLHAVDLMVNGRVAAQGAFDLRA